MARNTGELRLTWIHCVMMDHHFKTLQRPKEQSNQCDDLDSFQDPRQKQKKSVTFQDDPLIFKSIKPQGTNNSTSNHSSHSSHRVQHFSPHSPSSSPPAQLSSREKLVSPNAEDHMAPKHQIIRPQDVNKQMTSGLAALIQETSPIAPYKIQPSAKRKARHTIRNMR